MLSASLRRGAAVARRSVARLVSTSAGGVGAPSNAGYYGGIAVFGGMTVTVLGLGVWQTKRYFEKVDVIDSYAETLAQPALPASEHDLSALEGMMRAVELRGHYHHDQEMYVGIRAAPQRTAVFERAGGEKNGYFVFTPFTLEDGRTVMVSRGWVPPAALPRLVGQQRRQGGFEPAVERPEGQVTLKGVVRPAEKGGRLQLGADIASRHFYWVDLPQMAELAGVEEQRVFVEATSGRVEDPTPRNVEREEAEAGPWPLPKPLNSYLDFYVTPVTHVGYAVSWYGMAIAGVFLTGYYMRRGKARMAKAAAERAREAAGRV